MNNEEAMMSTNVQTSPTPMETDENIILIGSQTTANMEISPTTIESLISQQVTTSVAPLINSSAPSLADHNLSTTSYSIGNVQIPAIGTIHNSSVPTNTPLHNQSVSTIVPMNNIVPKIVTPNNNPVSTIAVLNNPSVVTTTQQNIVNQQLQQQQFLQKIQQAQQQQLLQKMQQQTQLMQQLTQPKPANKPVNQQQPQQQSVQQQPVQQQQQSTQQQQQPVQPQQQQSAQQQQQPVQQQQQSSLQQQTQQQQSSPQPSQCTVKSVLSADNAVLLTKTRLRELVKEVDPNEQLEEDVEDLMLQISDEFVDELVRAACMFAKHRKSNIVEVKDVQVYLERYLNMWIPGFGTDELRPYKKSPITEAHKQRTALIKKVASKKY